MIDNDGKRAYWGRILAAGLAVIVLVAFLAIGEARNQCADGAGWQICEWTGSTGLAR
jgi:hypothetical protein